jgi:hypothetical protein
MTRRSFGFLAAWMSAASLQTGCTAIIARSRVASAEEGVLLAERAGAENQSPYEYTAARLYLEKAREEESQARYGAAASLAAEAARLAETARHEAAQAARTPGATSDEVE